MYYVKKDDLVQVDRGEDGQFIVSREFDTQQVITEDEFYSEYVGVRKLRKERSTKKKMSSAELEEFIKQSIQFQGLDNQEEEDSYIKGQMELVNNKAF